jgi:hypothetical protein
VNPIKELSGLLPPAPPSRELPRRRQHETNLLTLMGAESVSRRWLGPAAAAAAVVVVAVLALTVQQLISDSGTVRSGRPGEQAISGGKNGPAFRARLTASRQWSVPAQRLSRVVVSAAAGSVIVAGGTQASVTVTATPGHQRSAPEITSRVTGGALTVAVSCPPVSQSCRASLQLSVPSGVAVTATTDLGNIRLAGLSGLVTAHTDEGSITATDLAAPQCTMTTDLGSIDALFSVPPTLVTAASQDGSVTIRLPSSASYDVTASTQLGGTNINVPRSASSGHVIRATSELGPVTVTG